MPASIARPADSHRSHETPGAGCGLPDRQRRPPQASTARLERPPSSADHRAAPRSGARTAERRSANPPELASLHAQEARSTNAATTNSATCISPHPLTCRYVVLQTAALKERTKPPLGAEGLSHEGGFRAGGVLECWG